MYREFGRNGVSTPVRDCPGLEAADRSLLYSPGDLTTNRSQQEIFNCYGPMKNFRYIHPHRIEFCIARSAMIEIPSASLELRAPHYAWPGKLREVDEHVA